MAANNINVDIILQSVGREGTKDISFTVASDDLEHALEVLDKNKERLTIKDITYNKDVAKLSVVGAGMMSNPGVASRMFEALYNSRVNINMISTSEIRITEHLYQAILKEEEHVKDIDYLTTLAGYVHWKLTGEKVLGCWRSVWNVPNRYRDKRL